MQMSQSPACSIDGASATASAGHRLAETYDILYRIFSGQRSRGTHGPYVLSRGDLARCTRVCRSFHEPVVRVLWSSLDGFVPLWQLLAPVDFHSRGLYSEECFRTVVEARRWDDAECWERFVKYSQHVRTLKYAISQMVGSFGSSTAASTWNKRLLQLLLEHTGGAPLLPSLRSLSWSWTSIEDAYVSLMLCPSLSELLIVYHGLLDDHETSLLTVLRRLQEISTHLASFVLQLIDDTGHWIVDELVQLRDLRNISLSVALDLAGVHALLNMPNIASLNANISVEDTSERAVTAPNLHTLDLNGPSPDLTRLFTTLDLPCLESLMLYAFDTMAYGPGLPVCTAAIAGSLHSSTLRQLQLTFNATFDSNQLPLSNPSDTSVSLSALLQPLLSHTPNLEIFNLRFDGPLKLWADDDVFEEMAHAWSLLQTLRLDFRAWHESGPMPTPAVLTRFARSCPALQELVLPYLNYRAGVDAALYKELNGHHALRRLFIADDRSMGTAGPDSDRLLLPLAQMVSDLFPHLDLSFRAYIKNPGMPWWKVFDCLRASPARPSASGMLHATSQTYLP